jgi:hypothetical protein
MLDRALSVTRQAAELAAKHATALAGRALELVGEVRRRVQGDDAETSRRVAAAAARAEDLAAAPTPPRQEPRRFERAAPVPAPAEPVPTPAEPVHIEVEEELVGQFAEQGAEDGAGAEISVVEPWAGYASMNASAVVDRLAAASPAQLAVVELYENGHKARKSILAEVQRRLS